jgi:hypothetical protein
MAISETRVWSSLYTTTMDDVRDEIPDQVHDHLVLTWFLKNQGRGVDRGGGKGIRFQQGGAKVRIPVVLEKNQNGKWYAKYENMNVNPTDEITNGIDVLRNLSITIGISGEELDQNRGDAAKFDLLREKTTIGYMTMAEMLEMALVQGTASGVRMIANAGGKACLPLGFLIQKAFASEEIHEINQNTETDWQNKVAESSAADWPELKKEMLNLYNQCSMGNTQDGPDFILADQNYYEVYENMLMVQQRYNYDGFRQDPEATAGFRGLQFKDASMYFSKFVPNLGVNAAASCSTTQAAATAVAFYINTRWLELVISSKVNFVLHPFEVPYDQDAMWAKLLFRGQMTMLQRRKHGVHYNVNSALAS